jgi:predicted nucleotidyltransferase
MNLPPEVDRMLQALLSGIQRTLQGNLVGVYLRGSLATGEFVPETSDLDLLAVTERPVDDAEFDALATLHAELTTLPNRYANRVEVAYIDRAALRRFVPGQRHPTLGQGEALTRSEHGDNWILERWTVRERGVTLLGPDPQGLIDPILSEDLRAAVCARLRDWDDWASRPDDPDWLLPRGHKAYVVETMCRALYTLNYGELPGKEHAVAWALEALSDPWRATVVRSRAWRGDNTPDASIVPEVRRFVRWVAAKEERAAAGGPR